MYRETLINEKSQKFNHINCLGKISVIPTWNTDKKKDGGYSGDVVGVNGGGAAGNAGDWMNSLRGKKRDVPGGVVDKGGAGKKKKDYLAENKRLNRAAR